MKHVFTCKEYEINNSNTLKYINENLAKFKVRTHKLITLLIQKMNVHILLYSAWHLGTQSTSFKTVYY